MATAQEVFWKNVEENKMLLVAVPLADGGLGVVGYEINDDDVGRMALSEDPSDRALISIFACFDGRAQAARAIDQHA